MRWRGVFRVMGVLVALAVVVCAPRPSPDLNAGAESPIVPTVPTEQVLGWIGAGKRVIFIDTREAQEYHEEHIPGAINVSLRDLERMDVRPLRQADLIIAYCLKDFRGFEVAKALRKAGFPQSAILREYGISGWKRLGLPTVTAGQGAEQAGVLRLLVCARTHSACAKGHT